MMRVVVVDITGRNAPQYNPSLCASLSQISDVEVVLMSQSLHGSAKGFRFRKLIKLMPLSMALSEGRIKKGIRLLEAIFNYFYIILYVLFSRPNILHFQWLPLLEYARGEVIVLKIIKYISVKTKLFFTVHNVFPHNMTEDGMKIYKERFLELDKYFDGYIVHLECSKNELSQDFRINNDKIHVAYHGIYVAENYNGSNTKIDTNDSKRIIMYGRQNHYKGTDLLMESLKLLKDDYLKKINVLIVGMTDPDLYEKYKCDCINYNVKWVNRLVSDKELYESIGSSDLILLPYRKISQSGVLLLALSYRKPILTSNLPSFKETLSGYPEDYFFESNNPQELANILERYIDGRIDEIKIEQCIDTLNEKYSWVNTGRKTYEAYKSALR